jgi:hypothetical protein
MHRIWSGDCGELSGGAYIYIVLAARFELLMTVAQIL